MAKASSLLKVVTLDGSFNLNNIEQLVINSLAKYFYALCQEEEDLFYHSLLVRNVVIKHRLLKVKPQSIWDIINMKGNCLWRHPLYLALWTELDDLYDGILTGQGNAMFDRCHAVAKELVELQEDYLPQFDDVRIDCYRLKEDRALVDDEFTHKKYPSMTNFYRPVPRTVNMTPCASSINYNFYTLNTNTWRYPSL